MRADDWPRRCRAAGRRRRGCRPGWSRSRRGRAAPGSYADRPHPPSRWVAKECRSECGRDPAGERRLADPEAEPAGDVGVGEPAAALGEEERLLARIGGQRAAAPAPGSARRARWAGSPTGSSRSFEPLPSTRSCSVSKSIDAEVEVDDLLAAQAAGVGQLEHRPVAQLQRRAGRDPLQQRAHLLGAEHLAAASARASGWRRARPGCCRPARCGPGSRRGRGSRRACGRRSPAPRRRRRGRRRSGARRGGGRRRAPRPCGRDPLDEAGRGRRRRRGGCARRRRARAGRGRTRRAPSPSSSPRDSPRTALSL